jgi:hypothetical protein
LITPKPVGKYVAMAMIESEWSDKNWQTISFPEADKRWYKFKNLVKKGEQYWIVPVEQGLLEIGSVCAIENTLDEAIKKVTDRAKELKGYDIEVHTQYFEEAKQEILKGEKEFKIKF